MGSVGSTPVPIRNGEFRTYAQPSCLVEKEAGRSLGWRDQQGGEAIGNRWNAQQCLYRMRLETLDEDRRQSRGATCARQGAIAVLRAVVRTAILMTSVSHVVDSAAVLDGRFGVAVSLSIVRKELGHRRQRPLSDQQEDG